MDGKKVIGSRRRRNTLKIFGIKWGIPNETYILYPITTIHLLKYVASDTEEK